MNLVKIGDIAEKYNISGRTLRYYEEIGLISSIRDEDSNYRYYDSYAEARLKEILLLRKVNIGIKEIFEILENNDFEKTESIFNEKIRSISAEISTLSEIKEALSKILHHLQQNRVHSIGQTNNIGKELLRAEKESVSQEKQKEEKKMNEKAVSIDNRVRTIKINPCTVAYYRCVSTSPEQDAWAVMRAWIKKNGLDLSPNVRYFGFNNPSPEQGNPEYGYEVWVTLSSTISADGVISVKQFDGGVYAVVTANGIPEIGDMWGRLHEWVTSKGYSRGNHQWLEEHIVVDESSWSENMQIDLMYPISK